MLTLRLKGISGINISVPGETKSELLDLIKKIPADDILTLFCISPEMSKRKDVYVCRQCWQAFRDEDKTWAVSREHSAPLSLLLVGSWGVDTVGLVWWNWFDKRGTITSLNETQLRMLTVEKRNFSYRYTGFVFCPQTHMQTLNWSLNSPVATHKHCVWPQQLLEMSDFVRRRRRLVYK